MLEHGFGADIFSDPSLELELGGGNPCSGGTGATGLARDLRRDRLRNGRRRMMMADV